MTTDVNRNRSDDHAPTRRSTVYFDKGAFSDLWRSTAVSERALQRVRRRLCSRMFNARPQVILGQWLLSEMAAMREDASLPDVARLQFKKELGLLKSLPDPEVLRDPLELMKAEIDAALGRSVLDPFLPGPVDLNMDEKDWDENWRLDFQLLRANQAAFARHEQRSKTAFATRLPDRKMRNRGLANWFQRRREDAVENWARLVMTQWRTELGLPRDRSRWPAPQTLPTIWGHSAHRVARIFLLNQRGRGIDPNDLADGGHYTAAMHADEFVTNDGWLIDIAAECPPPKPAVLRFDFWARRILSPEIA